MVQLKGIRAKTGKSVKHVSIPYGTIKRGGENGEKYFYTMFQFLMVQLKEYGRSTHNLSYAVSIPYGTIKRAHGNKTIDIYGVSIPYGTIKRVQLLLHFLLLRLFQFLMVQLKASKIK